MLEFGGRKCVGVAVITYFKSFSGGAAVSHNFVPAFSPKVMLRNYNTTIKL